jgi:hypothetical protein
MLAIWLPEKPKLKYPLSRLVPLESSYFVADFLEFSASWDQNIKGVLPLKRKRFFAWEYKNENFGFKCPDHRHDVGMIGYSGWEDLSKCTPEKIEIYDLGDKTYGWLLYVDNHDFGGDFLFAALWFDIIKNLEGIEVWTRTPFDRENNYIYSETEGLTKTKFSFKFHDEVIKGLTPTTNPLSQPLAVLFSDPERLTYTAMYAVSLEFIHEPE